MYAGCDSCEAIIISNEYRACESAFISLFIFPSTLQYLNSTQDKDKCPPIQLAFNNLNTNFDDLTSSAPSLNLPGLRSRRQTDATTQNVLNVGYIQQCIINQSFDFVRQYDVYRCVFCHGIACSFSNVIHLTVRLWYLMSENLCWISFHILLLFSPPRYAVGIVICSISLFTILFVLLGVAFGMIGFRKNIDPQDRTQLSHCGGICLLVYITGSLITGSLILLFNIIVRHCKGGF